MSVRKWQLVFFLILIAGPGISGQERVRSVFIYDLIGRWEGSGWAKVPLIGTKASFSGHASFLPDSDGSCYFTRVSADELLDSYSDTGSLCVDYSTDSVYWRIKSYSGKYADYRGILYDDSIVAYYPEPQGEHINRVTLVLATSDSLIFNLSEVHADSTKNRQVHLGFHRK